MNGYDRFLMALRRQQPDRVPIWELIVNEPTLSAWGAAALDEFVEQEDLDAITVFEDMRLTPLEDAPEWTGGREEIPGGDIVVDEWGIVWTMTEYGIPYPVTGPIRTE